MGICFYARNVSGLLLLSGFFGKFDKRYVMTEQKLSRSQRRQIERIESEARIIFEGIASKFLTFFLDSENPSGQNIVDRVQQDSAKWKVYCRQRNLSKEALNVMDNYCYGVIKQYQKEAQNTPELPIFNFNTTLPQV